MHLRKHEQAAAAFLKINPAGLIPALEHEGRVLTQSLAIIEYLEEIQPAPALLPTDPAARAYVRALALTIACDIHPLNNLRVLKYLSDELDVQSAQRDRWYAHWIETGFAGIESTLQTERRAGVFSCGDTPGLAEICLVPQVANAERLHCDLQPYPTIRRIAAAARALPAFIAAEPDRQPDAE